MQSPCRPSKHVLDHDITTCAWLPLSPLSLSPAQLPQRDLECILVTRMLLRMHLMVCLLFLDVQENSKSDKNQNEHSTTNNRTHNFCNIITPRRRTKVTRNRWRDMVSYPGIPMHDYNIWPKMKISIVQAYS